MSRFSDVTALRRRTTATDRRDARGTAVAELARRAFMDNDAERMMDLATGAVHELLEPSATAILQLEGDARSVAVRAARDWPGPGAVSGEPVELPALVARSRPPGSRPVTAVLGQESLPPHWRASGARCATITVVDDPSGLPAALVSLHRLPRRFAPEELDFLDQVARVVSGCLARAWWEAGERRRPLDDPLTGMANRSCMLDRLRKALDRQARREAFVVVYSIDLDRFRSVNETLGRQAGDEVLKTVAQRLRGSVRREDTVARMAADEFAVLGEEISGEAGAIRQAERLLEALAQPIYVHGREFTLNASIGIALCDSAETTAESLLRDADLAMRRAKLRIGSGYELFDPAMRLRATRRHSVEQGLRAALASGAFELHYQPIVSLDKRRIEGVEALLRWLHPTDGLIPPASFIPVAEESGLIVPIGEWVLAEACRQAARWAADPSMGDIYVTVNISGVQLADPAIVGQVSTILRRSGIDPGRIGLEVTESVLMRESTSPIGILHRLKALGVRLLLDDFGTGYSSLGQVKRLPVDVIKIDRSLVTGIGDEDVDRRILAAIVSMGDALGVGVVAEGIDDVRQARWLSRLGIRLAQGYGFARPKPAAAVEVLLREGLPPDRMALHALDAPEPRQAEPALPAPIQPREETLTLSEAATALSVSHSTMRRWANDGRVPSIRTPGGHRRFRVSDIRRLSAAVTGRAAPALRQVPPPSHELREVAEVLETRGDWLVAAARRALYDEGRGGWFAGPHAEEPLRLWVARVATACRDARWEAAVEATAALMSHSHRAGSSVAERHGFLERFTEATLRELQRAGVERTLLADGRRLFLKLLRVALTVGDTAAA